MHEMALTRGIVDTAVDYARRSDAQRVRAIFLRIGFARDIVDELLQSCFSYYARNTIARDASLIIQRVPVTARCNACGCVFPLNLDDDTTWRCPVCGTRDYRAQSGTEFVIDSIAVC